MTEVRGVALTSVRPRRNLRWILAGVLAICLGGIGSAVLYSNLSQSASVVLANRTIYRGEIITGADLGVVSIDGTVGLRTIPAERAPELIGKTALTDLPDGSLLVPTSVGDPPVDRGQIRLGLRLAPGRLPVSALPAGTPVLLVPLAKDGQGKPDGGSVSAQIATGPVLLPDGHSVLDVTVATNEAERVARLAAADLVVLVRMAGN